MTSEHDIQSAIIDLIRLRGGVVTRINSGSMITKRGDQTYRVQLADKGTSDIIALYEGVYLAIEVKAGNGKPTAEQLSFFDSVARAGGVGLLAYDVEFVDDVLDALNHGLTRTGADSINKNPHYSPNRIFISEVK